MLFTIAIALAQATPSAAALQNGIHNGREIINILHKCVDADITTQLDVHFSDATPELVTDAAIETCKDVAQELLLRTTDTLSEHMSREEAANAAAEMVLEQLTSIRDAQIKRIDTFMAGLKYAESRYKVAIIDWSACIREKAALWSTLKEDARTVAEAAVSACDEFKGNVRLASLYYTRSLNLPPSSDLDSMKSLESKIGSHAITWVVEARAKALAK